MSEISGLVCGFMGKYTQRKRARPAKEDNMQNTEIIKEVNGWEIKVDKGDRNTNIAPYSIRTGKKYNQVIFFESLKAAERWAEKH